MNRRKTLVGLGLVLALMALTGWILLRDLPLGTLAGILRRKEDLQRLLSAAVRSGQNGINFRKETSVGMTDQEIVQAAIQTLSVLFPSRDRIGVQFSVNQSQNIMDLGW